MFSSSTPPPPPPFLDKEIVKELQDDKEKDDTEKGISPFEPSPQFKSLDDSIGDTEKKLVETISSIRVPKINREWKKCISEIEKVIDIKPTDKEYNNFSSRKRIEQYKDRLGKDLYECKVNQKKKEENDKELEKLKRKKAQDEFEKRFEKKYNLQPNVIQSSQKSEQTPQPQQSFQQPQQSFQQPQQISEQQESSQPPQQDDEKDDEKDENKGFFSKIFGDSSEDEDSEDELDKVNQENDLLEKKEEIVDSINMYLKSQAPELSQNIDIRDIKGIDNLLEQYEDLVNNHEKLTDVFQKYKEKQKVNNVKNDHLLDEQEETIDNLTTIIVKLEKKIKTYKKNAEKKFIAQGELHEESLKKKDKELKKKLKQKDDESREIHKYMQSLLNERIETANNVIKELSDDTERKILSDKKSSKKKSRKLTKKKKKKKN